jgi:hypothetical protein
MAARNRQSSLETSNRRRTEPSGKRRAVAEEKSFSNNLSGRVPLNARLSPHIAPEDRRRSHNSRGEAGSVLSAICNVPSGLAVTKPRKNVLTPEAGVKNMACTFVDSVMSLCSKSSASCGVNGDGDGAESIFLDLVPLCGVEEARFWCQMFGFKYERSYAALATLFYGVAKLDVVSNSPIVQT